VTRKIQIELARSILSELPPPKRTFALVIGLNSCGLPDSPELLYAEEDARSVAELLSEAGYDDVLLLKGQDATLKAIEDALAQIAARTDIDVESLIVYFAGLGTSTYDEVTSTCSQYVLTYGAESEDCQLDLSHLAYLAALVSADHRVVMIDAGFTGSEGRTYSVGDVPAGIKRVYSETPAAKTGVAFLMSCQADETAFESDDLGHGVFTSFLLERGLRNAADMDEDGAVTVDECARSVGWLVTRHVRANTQGLTQKPCTFGKDASETELLRLK
jgi:uncharacterized caspase-like protein